MIDAYRVAIFIPPDAIEGFIEAIQDAVPSFLGNYDRVMWWRDPKIEKGTGQFRPLDGANPAYGEIGKTERIEDIRLEFLMPHDKVTVRDIVESIIRPNYPFDDPVIYINHTEVFEKL